MRRIPVKLSVNPGLKDLMRSGVKLGGVFTITCRDPQGNIKWRDTAKNIVPNAALNYILECLFESAQSDFGEYGPYDPWYVGLLDEDSVGVAAGDTMASHGGWTEVTAYDEAVRQEFINSAVASQSVNNTSNKATFTISSDSTAIDGAFMSSDSTKSGSSGLLLCCAPFSGGTKTADDNDTLEVQYTFSAADDGV